MLDFDNGFMFDEHVYDGLLKLYCGSYEFSKHYLGPHRVPAFDGSGEGEEFECAKLIDAHPQVDCWLRNVANDARSFRLPIATEKGRPVVLRAPIVPGYNDRPEHFHALAAAHANVLRIDLEPYHPLGRVKAEALGRDWPLGDVPTPTAEMKASWARELAERV